MANLKKVEVVNIAGCTSAVLEADGEKIIVLTGDNEQGKTSFVKAIMLAFGGNDKRNSEHIRKVVTMGQKEGHVSVELDSGYVVSRTFKASAVGETDSLTITSGEGKKLASPATWIKEHYKQTTLNPLEFADGDNATQIKLARKAVSMAVGSNVTELQDIYDRYADRLKKDSNAIEIIEELINDRNGLIYTERRELGKEIRAIEGSLSLDVKDKKTEIEEQKKLIAVTEQDLAVMEGHEKFANSLSDLHTKFVAASQALKDQIPENAVRPFLKKLTAMHSDIAAGVPEMQAIVDDIQSKVTPLREALQNQKTLLTQMETTQKLYDDTEKQRAELETKRKEHAERDAELTKLKEIRDKMVASIKLPVTGMEIRDDGVYLDDVHFSQVSMARRIQVSMALGMQLHNPDSEAMKIMFVENGGALTERMFDEIKKTAIENDYTVFIEVPARADVYGWYFEHGNLKTTPAARGESKPGDLFR